MAFENNEELAQAMILATFARYRNALHFTPELRRKWLLEKLRQEMDDLQAEILKACDDLCPIK